MMELLDSQLKIPTPFRGLIGGPSASGKTFFISRLLINRASLFDTSFTRIIYCHPHDAFVTERDQDFFNFLELNVPGIEILAELPSLSNLQTSTGPTLLILEDMMQDIVSNPNLLKLYTVFSSHCSLSIITTTQNYFEQGRHSKTILRNQTFIVLFDSLSDRQATAMVSRQLFPTDKNFLPHCFSWLRQNVLKKEYRYIFVDCVCNNLPAGFPQARTNLMQENPEFEMIGFMPKTM